MSSIAETLEQRPALKALGEETCVCGAKKTKLRYFCLPCWRNLGRDIKKVMQFKYLQVDSEGAYRLAVEDLKAKGRVPEEAS